MELHVVNFVKHFKANYIQCTTVLHVCHVLSMWTGDSRELGSGGYKYTIITMWMPSEVSLSITNSCLALVAIICFLIPRL